MGDGYQPKGPISAGTPPRGGSGVSDTKDREIALLRSQLADREARLEADRSWLRRASLSMKEAYPLCTTAYLVARTEEDKERIRVFNEQFSELQYYIDCHLRGAEPLIMGKDG